uniref:Uncharacterized protein n=1 Tax=Romanomermis culicivorax TaxID=13658 RepID=A0A915JZ19_ROMCU
MLVCQVKGGFRPEKAKRRKRIMEEKDVGEMERHGGKRRWRKAIKTADARVVFYKIRTNISKNFQIVVTRFDRLFDTRRYRLMRQETKQEKEVSPLFSETQNSEVSKQ